MHPVLLQILRITSLVFLISTTVRPGKWAIIITHDVPSYYIALSCITYTMYLWAFKEALENKPSAKYILAVGIIGRLGMELTVPHTHTAIKLCLQLPEFSFLTIIALYIAIFATILPIIVLIKLLHLGLRNKLKCLRCAEKLFRNKAGH